MEEAVKANSLIAAAAGGTVLLGSMLPLATNGLFTASISHLGAVTNILYVLPVPLLGAAALALHGKISNPRWWYIVIGAIGLALSVLTATAAVSHIETFGRMFGGMPNRFFGASVEQAISPTWALGAYALVVGYGAAIAAGILPAKKLKPVEAGL